MSPTFFRRQQWGCLELTSVLQVCFVECFHAGFGLFVYFSYQCAFVVVGTVFRKCNTVNVFVECREASFVCCG